MAKLTLTGVAVEKVHFLQNSEKLGDRKCLGKRRKSFVGHPGAIFFANFAGRSFSTATGITRNIKGAHFAVSCDRWESPLTERSAVMNQEKYIGMDVH
jgi:hypothetical protein